MKTSLLTTSLLIIAMSSVAQVTGSFIDSRDSTTYKTVIIGTQTWMAENLAYKTESGCWAYNDTISYVATYGYLYNWEATKDVCPIGWHLPSKDEWVTLIWFVGAETTSGLKLKAIKCWDGDKHATNKFGFTALPSGALAANGKFFGKGNLCRWWTSTNFNTKYAVSYFIDWETKISKENMLKEWGLSVRCIKD
ncbi:MAG: fibrobacter succinogenes major paralogous domain-containing protein [bacterium]